jgi:DNA-binding MarR family transcriptional regulator
MTCMLIGMPARRRSIADEIHQTRPFTSRGQEVTVALLRTADEVRRRLGKVVEAEDITLQQYNVLRILRGARNEPLSALQIGERLIEQMPGVSRLIERLVAKKLVRRDRGSNDRRMIECFITQKGLDLLARLDHHVNAADEAVVSALSARELAALDELLARIRGANDG